MARPARSCVAAALAVALGAAPVFAGSRGALVHRPWQRGRWSLEEAAPGRPITALVAAPGDALFAGTRGGGVRVRRAGAWSALAGADDVVEALARGADGALFAAGAGGLKVLRGESFEDVPVPAAACPREIRTVAADGEGALWIASCGLHRLSPPIFDLAPTRAPVRAIAPLPGGGGVLVAREDGLAVLGRGGVPCPAGKDCAECFQLEPAGDGLLISCGERPLLEWRRGALVPSSIHGGAPGLRSAIVDGAGAV